MMTSNHPFQHFMNKQSWFSAPCSPALTHGVMTRRQAVAQFGGGLAGIACGWLLAQAKGLGATVAQATAAAPAAFDLSPRPSQFAGRARNVIFLYMGGGPSQMDLLDPKPMLTRHDGKPIPQSITQRAIGGSTLLMGSPFKFSRHGQSGLELSELLPHLGRVADDIAVIRSGVTTRIDHGEALLMMHTGRPISGFPSLGCWVTYALGTENNNLPAYVAMPDSDPERTRNAISSGWLPALYQGTPFNTKGNPITDLTRPATMSAAQQERYLRVMQGLNRRHAAARPELNELDARIKNFELAARLQVEAMRQVDLSTEPDFIRQLYGLEQETTRKFGTQCLLARRLVEAGVRFVHLIRNDWDHHGKLRESLTRSTLETDQPVAALVQDLKQRGLLESTLVIWAGEFGRLPVVQGTDGRDHNPAGFSFWMAGGGVRGGTVYGATDDFGYASVQDSVTMADFHATVLHLLGLRHERVTFPFEGRDESLVGIERAEVVRGILG